MKRERLLQNKEQSGQEGRGNKDMGKADICFTKCGGQWREGGGGRMLGSSTEEKKLNFSLHCLTFPTNEKRKREAGGHPVYKARPQKEGEDRLTVPGNVWKPRCIAPCAVCPNQAIPQNLSPVT